MNYRLKPDLLLQSVADETVILDPESGNYYTLDAVGTRMIELLQETGSEERAITQLLLEYDVSSEVLRADLAELLEDMKRQGLVEGP